MPGGLTSRCGRSRLTGFWEGCERRAATARGRVPDVLSLLSPRPTSLCCALAFPVSFLHAWRVSLSTHLSRMVGWRRVLLVFPGGLVAWRRIRGGLLCAWRTRFREVCAHLCRPCTAWV